MEPLLRVAMLPNYVNLQRQKPKKVKEAGRGAQSLFRILKEGEQRSMIQWWKVTTCNFQL